ncbi:hypothetical protein GQR58_009758 [Nymphon striatum]|nr:hypothetical protein GQR58_009758 [Nymphon striatum]
MVSLECRSAKPVNFTITWILEFLTTGYTIFDIELLNDRKKLEEQIIKQKNEECVQMMKEDENHPQSGHIVINCTSNGTWQNHEEESPYYGCMDPYHGRNLTDSQKKEMVVLSKKLRECRKLKKKDETLHGENSTIGGCPPIWKTVMCWPRAPPDMVIRLKCPDYVSSFNNTEETCNSTETNKMHWIYYFNDQSCLGFYNTDIDEVSALQKDMFKLRAGMCLLMNYLFTNGYLGLRRTISELQHLGYAVAQKVCLSDGTISDD